MNRYRFTIKSTHSYITSSNIENIDQLVTNKLGQIEDIMDDFKIEDIEHLKDELEMIKILREEYCPIYYQIFNLQQGRKVPRPFCFGLEQYEDKLEEAKKILADNSVFKEMCLTLPLEFYYKYTPSYWKDYLERRPSCTITFVGDNLDYHELDESGFLHPLELHD